MRRGHLENVGIEVGQFELARRLAAEGELEGVRWTLTCSVAIAALDEQVSSPATRICVEKTESHTQKNFKQSTTYRTAHRRGIP